MNFEKHSNLNGQHAFLGASKYHWINYDEEKLASAYFGFIAAQKGTELHGFAEQCIRLGQKLPRSNRTLNRYVNDSISFCMTPEQVLYYSDNCFGTADAIAFSDNVLRINDLKTGDTPGHVEQLCIYAALFCLEYHVKPSEIAIELRIYQNDDVQLYIPEAGEISLIIEKIIDFDKVIKKIKEQEG